jgi:hypothetical protein
MKPTFIGIGAQKCASTWLYEMLRDHPQVLVSERKELDFFSYHYENGFRWYENCFEPKSNVKQVGEISPSYLHEAGVAERAKMYRADLLIMVSIRDPVQRALSQHRHMVKLGLVPETDLSFETALASNPTYFEQGQYYRHLSRWINLFGSGNVHITIMDDIRRDSKAVVRDLYSFLRIDSAHNPKAQDEARNKSYIVRNAKLDQTVQVVREAVRTVAGDRLWKALGSTGLRDIYHAANHMDSSTKIPEPHLETLQALRERFRPDIESLSKMMQRDLSHWLL